MSSAEIRDTEAGGAEDCENPTPASDMPTLLTSPARGDRGTADKGALAEKVQHCEAMAPPEKLETDAPGKNVHWRETCRSTGRILSMVFRSKRTRWIGATLATTIVTLLLMETFLAAWITELFSASTNAMDLRDEGKFNQAIEGIAIAAACHLPVVMAMEAAEGAFAIEWRRIVTKHLLEGYINGNQAYYRMKSLEHIIDNPDQRIGQDIQEFTENIVKVFKTVVGSFLKVAVVSGLLINISPPLYLYLVGGSVVFTIVFLKMFGGQLMRLTRVVLGQEATFRFALIRVRENAESIAFFQGALFELYRCTQLVEKVLRTYYKRLMVWVAFSGGQKAVVTYAGFLPTIMLGPAVFRGEVTVGTIAQTNMLFSMILTSLTALIADLQTLASLGAQSVRIEQLRIMLDSMEGSEGGSDPSTSIVLRQGDAEDEGVGADAAMLDVECLTLVPPRSATPLVSDLSFRLCKGQSLLLCGASGIGKSSLLRAIGGLWSEGVGSITRCATDRSFFLPQRPYLCLGTLRENVEYPSPPSAQAADDIAGSMAIVEALGKVGLGYLPERHGLDSEVDFDAVLSGGEKQRLGFARLLLRPDLDFAILDEPTSALDPQNEQLAYRLLVSKVSTFVSVGHRATLEKFHTHKLLLERLSSGGATGTLRALTAN